MSNNNFNLRLNHKIKSFKKTIEVDSDKSISIRSFLISSISNNISKVTNILESEDVLATIQSLKKLGVKIKKVKSKNYLIFGKGLGSFFLKKGKYLNFGNSGTLARLLIGILSTTPNIRVFIKGDHSLNKRSMKKLVLLMTKFGAEFLPKRKFYFPLELVSSSMPIGIKYEAGVSAQLKSAVILAGLNSYGITEITEKNISRNHTENMLLRNNKVIKINKINDRKKIKIFGKKNLNSLNFKIPGDPSSAAFFSALTLLSKSSILKIKNVGLNPTRIGFYNLLKKHGAKIKFVNIKEVNNEKSGDIIVSTSKLKPIKADQGYYVNSTDEYPILFVLASLLDGVSTFKGVSDLANKESNRITEMCKILKQIGVRTSSTKSEVKIYGGGMINASKKRIVVEKLGDHRICMSAFILAILTGSKTTIKNFNTVYTSSPSFLKIMKRLKVKFEIQK